MNDNNRTLPIKGGFNFRELGGYANKDGKRVKFHKLLRSSGLGRLTVEDCKFLADYGLSKIIDFRAPDERSKEPDKDIPGIENIHMPVFEVDETKNSIRPHDMVKKLKSPTCGEKQMMNVYKDIVENPHANRAYQQFFEVLLANDEENKSIMFHCTAGKDRTGFGAILFLAALDIPEEIILADYLLSNRYIEEFATGRLVAMEAEGAPDYLVESMRDLFYVRETYYQSAMERIKEISGSIDNYLNDIILIDRVKRSRLAEIYLEQ